MVSRFFRRPSRSLKHHTVSLLPEVEAIIQASVSHFTEHVTHRTGYPANFSLSINLIALGRLTYAVTEQRKGRKPDPNAEEWLMDLIDGRRRITKEDLDDYTSFLASVAQAYNKRYKIPRGARHEILIQGPRPSGSSRS